MIKKIKDYRSVGNTKHIKNIDYGINMWNPEFGFTKNKTKKSEGPGDVIIENQFKGSAWTKIELESKYYFTPIETNLAKLIYGQMVRDNNMKYQHMTREEQQQQVFSMSINKLIKFHFPDLTHSEYVLKVKQFKSTIEKLMKLRMTLTTDIDNIETIEPLNFLTRPKLIHDRNENKLILRYKLSEWFDVERKLADDKRGITTDYLIYQQVDIQFPIKINKFNRIEQSILTYFKTIFDFKKGKKIIEFNIENEIKKFVHNFDDLSYFTQREHIRNYKKSFKNIEDSEEFGKYFKSYAMGVDYEVSRF